MCNGWDTDQRFEVGVRNFGAEIGYRPKVKLYENLMSGGDELPTDDLSDMVINLGLGCTSAL